MIPHYLCIGCSNQKEDSICYRVSANAWYVGPSRMWGPACGGLRTGDWSKETLWLHEEVNWEYWEHEKSQRRCQQFAESIPNPGFSTGRGKDGRLDACHVSAITIQNQRLGMPILDDCLSPESAAYPMSMSTKCKSPKFNIRPAPHSTLHFSGSFEIHLLSAMIRWRQTYTRTNRFLASELKSWKD